MNTYDFETADELMQYIVDNSIAATDIASILPFGGRWYLFVAAGFGGSGGGGPPPPTPLTDPTYNMLTGTTWGNSDARFLFPPSNLYPAIDEIGAVADGAAALTVLCRIAMPAAGTNLVDGMTVWARRLDGFDFQAQLVINANRSITAGVSGNGATWLQLDTAAGALALGETYTIAFVFDGAGATAAQTLRVFITDGMGEVTQASPTYSGAAAVATLFTPAFCGWTLGGVYTSDTTMVRGLRDVVVFDVAMWTGLAAEGYALVRACYAEDQTDWLGAFTERLVCNGGAATSSTFGGSGLPLGTLAAAVSTEFEGFRRYPASFVSTLQEPGRSVLQDPQAAGTSPFSIVPGDNSYVETNMNVYNLGTGVETPTPNAFVLVSGTASNQPAGLFGDTTGAVFSGPAGFVMHVIASVDVNSLGTRGTIGALARAFGPTFEPSGLAGIGYSFDSNDAVVDGWNRMVGVAQTALGGDAPRDGRQYAWLIVHEAGATSSWMALIDRSDRFNPVLVEQGTYTYPFAANVDAWMEINASPTANGVPGPVRRNSIPVVEGCLAYTG
jgi:hypothetical protein